MMLSLRIGALLALIAGASPIVLAQSNALTITPASVVICGKPGQLFSAVPVSISTSSGSVTFVTTSVGSDGNWLTADPISATVTSFPHPQLVLGFNGAFIPFAEGVYTGQVVLGTFDGAKLATIPVSLQVTSSGCGATNNGALFADSGPITLQIPPGATASNLINIYNSFPTNVTVVPMPTTTTLGQTWISIIESNLTAVTGLMYPTPLNIDFSAQGLGAGTYTGNIEVAASDAVSLNVPLTLVVNPSAGDARFAANPAPLSIGVRSGTVSTNAEIKLTNLTSSVVSILTSATSDRFWLSATPATAVLQPKSTISLIANIAGSGLQRGANRGAIHVQVTSGNGGALDIPVTVTSGVDSEITAQSPVSLNASAGSSAPVTFTLPVSNAAGITTGVSFSTSAFSSVYQPWLSVAPFNPTAMPGAPAILTITVQPATLPAGPAIGSITLKPVDGSAPLVIPVNVNAGIDTSLTATPTQLSFTYQAGGALPQTQSLALTGTVPNSYSLAATTTTGGAWLIVNPASAATSGGSTPTSVTVQVNPTGLAPNTYQGQIAITNINSGAQQIVPVTLTIGQPLSLSANPAALSFNYQLGGPATSPVQSVLLASSGGSAAFVATTSGLNGGPNFLTLNTSSSTTPATLTIGLNAAVLPSLVAGEYSATVTLSSPGVPSSQMVVVKLVVSPAGPQPQSVVSSASSQTGAVSPGELVSIFGTNLGPATGVPFAPTSQGTVPLQLGGVMVTFDDFAAPLLYVGSGQINAVVPYEIAGRTQANLVISRNGVASAPFVLAVAATAPAIFSTSQNGSGPGAILNEDSSPNNDANPAAKGSVIQIFATGEGTYPGALTGTITSLKTSFALFPTPVSLTIGGQPAVIQFIGEAPGLLSGILQVNAVVPGTLGSGPQPVALSVGENNNSQQSITVVIQ